MKNLALSNDLHIGDEVCNILPSRVCSSYPLEDFPGYTGQKRNNSITAGTIISFDIDPEVTFLIEQDHEVIAVRHYPVWAYML